MLLSRLGSPGLLHDSDAVHPRYQLLALLAELCFSRVTSASGRHNNVGACEGHQWTKKLAIPLRRVHAAPDRQNPKDVSSTVPWSSSQGDHATQGRPLGKRCVVHTFSSPKGERGGRPSSRRSLLLRCQGRWTWWSPMHEPAFDYFT